MIRPLAWFLAALSCLPAAPAGAAGSKSSAAPVKPLAPVSAPLGGAASSPALPPGIDAGLRLPQIPLAALEPLGAPESVRSVQGAALGQAARERYNPAARGAAPAQGAAGSEQSRAAAGAAFDLSAEKPVFDSAAVEAEAVYRPGVAVPQGGAAPALIRAADEFARNRAIRAQLLAQGRDPAEGLSALQLSELRGADELARDVAVTRTTPEQLRRAAEILDAMPAPLVSRLTQSALKFLATETPSSTPFARGPNWEHVEKQHLLPLESDAGELARLYARPGQSVEEFAARVKLLMAVHDLGKMEIPADMKAALAKTFPEKNGMWFVNMYILPHEYASFHFIEKLGREAGADAGQILALQRLIANHNFGPDLSSPRNKTLRDHWWPANFRGQMIPALSAMGVPVEKHLARDEEGRLQYNGSQGHPYTALLAAYDRALANRHTFYGVSGWHKFANQNHSTWLGALKGARQANAASPAGALKHPDPEPAFTGPKLVAAQEQAVQWMFAHVESLWKGLYEEHPPAGGWERAGYPSWNRFQDYPPFKAQREGVEALAAIIARVKSVNLEPGAGVFYRTGDDSALGKKGTLFRVTMRVDPGPAPDSPVVSAVLEQRLESGAWGKPAFAEGLIPTSSANPVDLFFNLLKNDGLRP